MAPHDQWGWCNKTVIKDGIEYLCKQESMHTLTPCTPDYPIPTPTGRVFLVRRDDLRYLTPAQLRRIAEQWGIDTTLPTADVKNAVLNSRHNEIATSNPIAERHDFFTSIGSRNYMLTGNPNH